MSHATTDLHDYWTTMVTVALLGTDRRDPPVAPMGGLADLAADQPESTPSQRLLQQVSAASVVRRAGFVPGSALAAVAPPDVDLRPVTAPGSTLTWRRIVAHWPVLVDEFVLAVVRSGHRLAPELVPLVLHRHRSDAVRHARGLVAAGPLGSWLAELTPRLACATRKRPSAEAVAELPELAITPELTALLAAPAKEVASVVAGGMSSGVWGVSHRNVLVNFVARVRPDALLQLASALDRVDPTRPSLGLAFSLADLARLRHHMLTELEPV
jgi:hypothetical protein